MAALATVIVAALQCDWPEQTLAAFGAALDKASIALAVWAD